MSLTLRPVPWGFLALGALTLCGALAYGFLPEPPAPRAQLFIGLQLLMAVVALAALKAPGVQPPPLLWVLAVAAGVRLACLPSDLIFENDVFRYLWDARVSAHGINPYAYAPADEALAALRDDWIFPQIPYRQVSTIYPPVAQALFSLSRGLFGESVEGLQVVMTVLDLGTVVAVYLLGRALNAPRAAAAYALHPLALKEFAQGAHVDAAAVLLLAWAGVLLVGALPHIAQRARAAGPALLLAGAALTKAFPLVLLPLLWRSRGTRAVLLFLAATAVPLLLISVLGGAPLSGLSVFARFWIFNPSMYDAVVRALTLAVAPEVAHAWARPLCGLAAGGLILLISARADVKDPRELLRALTRCLFVLLLFSPAANPWYVAWMLPFALVCEEWPALIWTLVVSLCYAFHIEGQDAPGWRGLEYLPVGLALALPAFWRRWRQRRALPG